MYRTMMPLLLCASAVIAAPQKNSNITYVKRQPDLEQSTPELKTLQRESRIENLPLTIPANVDTNTEAATTAQTVKKQPTYNYSDRIYSIKTKPKTTTSTEKTITNEEVKEIDSVNFDDNLNETNNSDIVPAESILNDRVAANDNTELNAEATEVNATQSDEFVTEKYEEAATLTTVVEEETTKAPTARQLAKLSHYGKSTSGSFSQNLIANGGKRRFRSRCRCEKIWNCTKLQITVPRCPDEYFMCCS